MKVGDIAKATGLKVHTVRFYEAEGLIAPPSRSGGNYRIYDIATLNRLSFIKRSRDLGFTLGQVRELLRLADDPDASHEEVDAIAAAHVAEIDRKLADLSALRAELVQRLDACAGGSIGDCRIIDALSPRQAQVFPNDRVRRRP